ncbi:hypothetical protein BGW80DRAFT_382164 [Lactifluus volemus]|nr:hypothetical protein BGW80DRAFT_382164 [Lactifluus volemus]
MGLFSATVATVLSVTWQDLRQDPHSTLSISISFNFSVAPTRPALPPLLNHLLTSEIRDLGERTPIHELVSQHFHRNFGYIVMAMDKFKPPCWSSNLLSDSEKMRRLVVCVNFADSVRLPGVAFSILQDIFPRDRHNALRSVEMSHFLRSQGDSTQREIGLCAQSIVAGIISNVQERNNR